MELDEAVKQTEKVARLQIAERAKTDLYFLAKHILNYDLMEEDTHQDMCDYVMPTFKPELAKKEIAPLQEKSEDNVQDSYDPKKNFVLYLLPRGTFKSSVITIAHSIQRSLNDQDCRILIDSETFSKSKAFLAEIKGHYETNSKLREIYKTLFGVYPDAMKKKTAWSDSHLNLAARKRPRKEPSFSCSGVDASKTGMHYDLIVMDDLHSEKNVTTKEQIDNVIQHYKLALSLLDPGCPLIVIGTRWHYADLYQYILDYERDRFNILIRSAWNPDGTLFFPQRLDEKFLETTKKTQGGYIFSCNPGYAPVLMSDWSVKRLEDVVVGDEVIGYELGDGTRKNKLTKTRVTEINSRMAMTQDVKLDSSRNIRCTPDHQWYTGRRSSELEPYRKSYKPVEVGSTMLEVLDTDIGDKDSTDNLIAYSYLAGMIDGEGAAKYGSINISQSEKHHPQICERIRDTLDTLELPYKTGKDYTVINGGRQSKFDILRFGKPAKAEQIQKTLWDKPGMLARRKSKVVEITPYKKEQVYALTTETGNYVVWGMASKNCQYLNNPVDNETATFKRSYFKRKRWSEVKDIPINWYLMVDPSYEGQYSDYAAFVVAGMDFESNLYVRHITRQKMTYAGIIKHIFELNSRFEFRGISLETVATQKSITYELTNEQKRRGHWLRNLVEVKSRSVSKEERIRGLAPFYEFGRVYHIEGAPQLDELEYELLHFPLAKHDDVIDAFADILEIATPPSHIDRETLKERKKTRTAAYDKPRSPITGV